MKKSIVPEFTSANEAKVTTNLPYAKWQHEGFESRITGKQAWWMVINLFGYDPAHPEKFGREAFGKKEKGLMRKKKLQRMEAYGRMMAHAIWMRLVGRSLRIPAARWSGMNREDLDEIENIAGKRVDIYINRRMSGRLGT